MSALDPVWKKRKGLIFFKLSLTCTQIYLNRTALFHIQSQEFFIINQFGLIIEMDLTKVCFLVSSFALFINNSEAA